MLQALFAATSVAFGAVTHLMQHQQAPCQSQRVGIIEWYCDGDRFCSFGFMTDLIDATWT